MNSNDFATTALNQICNEALALGVTISDAYSAGDLSHACSYAEPHEVASLEDLYAWQVAVLDLIADEYAAAQ